MIISHPLEGGDHLGPIDCPGQTTFENETYYQGDNACVTSCSVNVLSGFDHSDLILSDGSIYLKLDAQCTIGTQAAADGELLCYLGTAPEGMKAFVWPNSQGSFYWDGLD